MGLLLPASPRALAVGHGPQDAVPPAEESATAFQDPAPRDPTGGNPTGGQEAPAADPFADPERTARGAAMLASLLEAAGGMESWQASQGYCYQVLATDRVLVDRRTETWKVNTYMPSLVAFDPRGNGYLYTETVEFVNGGREYRAQYRRAVREDAAAWAEMGPAFFRDAETIANVEAELGREFLLACMPFSLSVARASLAYWREQEVEGGMLEAYFMRLHKPQRMEDFEPLKDFILYVDPMTQRVARLQYVLSGKDSDKLKGTTTAFVSFNEWSEHTLPAPAGHATQPGAGPGTGEPAAGDGSASAAPAAPTTLRLVLPSRRFFWHEDPLAEEERSTLRQRFEPIPPERLRRPWTSGGVYLMPERADAWDPPQQGTVGPAPAGE